MAAPLSLNELSEFVRGIDLTLQDIEAVSDMLRRRKDELWRLRVIPVADVPNYVNRHFRTELFEEIQRIVIARREVNYRV